MGEESPALLRSEPANAVISHRRLLVEMAVLVILGTVVGSLFGGARFGIGVLIGGALAFGNYFWLKRSTESLFETAFSGGRTPLPAIRFIARYVVLGLVILAIHYTGLLPAAAVIAGLAAFALAVVVDGIVSIFKRTV